MHAHAVGRHLANRTPRALRPAVTAWATLVVTATPGQRITSQSAGMRLRRVHSPIRAYSPAAALAAYIAAIPQLGGTLDPAIISTALAALPALGIAALEPAHTRRQANRYPQRPTHIAADFVAYPGHPLGSGIRLAAEALATITTNSQMRIGLIIGDDHRLHALYLRLGFTPVGDRTYIYQPPSRPATTRTTTPRPNQLTPRTKPAAPEPHAPSRSPDRTGQTPNPQRLRRQPAPHPKNRAPPRPTLRTAARVSNCYNK